MFLLPLFFVGTHSLSCTSSLPTSLSVLFTTTPPPSWYASLADDSSWYSSPSPYFPISCSPSSNCTTLYGEGTGEGEGGGGDTSNDAGVGSNEALLLLRDQLVWGTTTPSSTTTSSITCDDGTLPSHTADLTQFALHVVVTGPTKEARVWLNGKSFPLDRDDNTYATAPIDATSILEQSPQLLVALRFLQDTKEDQPLTIESVVLITQWADATTTTTAQAPATTTAPTRHTRTPHPRPGTTFVPSTNLSTTASSDGNVTGSTATEPAMPTGTSSPHGPTPGDSTGKASHGTLGEVLVILAIVLGAIVAVGCTLRAVRRARSRKQSEGFKLLLQDGEEFDDEDNGLFA